MSTYDTDPYFSAEEIAAERREDARQLRERKVGGGAAMSEWDTPGMDAYRRSTLGRMTPERLTDEERGEIADALELLAGIDEGEHTDTDALHRLAGRVRAGAT